MIFAKWTKKASANGQSPSPSGPYLQVSINRDNYDILLKDMAMPNTPDSSSRKTMPPQV